MHIPHREVCPRKKIPSNPGSIMVPILSTLRFLPRLSSPEISIPGMFSGWLLKKRRAIWFYNTSGFTRRRCKGDTPHFGVPPKYALYDPRFPIFPDPEVILIKNEGEFHLFSVIFTSKNKRSYIAILQRPFVRKPEWGSGK